MPTDYYEILGVPRDASSQDIKKAFRKIARECHPDVSGGDPAAEEKFKKSRTAYDTLMDPVTRARYDRRGQRLNSMGRGGSFFDAFYKSTGKKGPGSHGGAGGTPGGGRRSSRPIKNDPRNDLGLDDLFNVGEFGFGSRVGRGEADRNPGRRAPPPVRNRPSPGRDIDLDLDVPTDVAARGGSVTAVYYRMQRADSWRPGTDDPGLVRVQDIADIRIVPGTRQGTILREKGLGEAGPFGGAYGDLVVRVRLVGAQSSAPPPASSAPPPTRSGHDAEVVALEISVVEALLGGRVALDTPQGRVRLTIPPGTSGGTRLRLKGKGSPLATGAIGDLFVETRILVPKTLDEESRALIEEFAKLNP